MISLVLPDQVKGVKRMQRTSDLADRRERAEHLLAWPSLRAVPGRLAGWWPIGARASGAHRATSRQQGCRRDTCREGTIKFFDTKRGFGFIDRGTGTDLFVHHCNLDVAGHRLTRASWSSSRWGKVARATKPAASRIAS